MTEGRVWQPIPGAIYREFCTVSDQSVRVVREPAWFKPDKRFLYEIQVWDSDVAEWVIVNNDEIVNAHVAFRKAARWATRRDKKVTVTE